ncbi:MAG TPA: hypothetical protein VL728_02575 [Cyclobacteriaceae bacterium]|jgi:hypothetical protein|nr:hypothetical protein [Cyclobacteriaceae bacterium]
MIAAKSVAYFTAVDKALVRAILYFDIFNYPITADEARAFAPSSIKGRSDHLLDNLVSQGILFKLDEFYSVRNDPSMVTKRLEGNRLAERRMQTARKYSRLIASFPFVRAVMLSGSISKNFMVKDSDIDYFIVTEKKRLWIARTMLTVFRRVFLLNSLRNFCVNYFIDTDHLEIPDHNIFTATELATLRSMYGASVIREFRNQNQWVSRSLPQVAFDANSINERNFYLKRFVEGLALFVPMDGLNTWLMNISRARWKRKYQTQYEETDFEIAFRCQEGVSKCHPRFFQKRALDLLENKIRAFEFQHGIDLML